MIHHRGEDLWVWSRVGDGRLEAHGLDLRSGELMRICASRLTVEESGFPVAPILAEGVLNHLRVARARHQTVGSTETPDDEVVQPQTEEMH